MPLVQVAPATVISVIQNLRIIMICCVLKCSLVCPNGTGLVMGFGFSVVYLFVCYFILIIDWHITLHVKSSLKLINIQSDCQYY